MRLQPGDTVVCTNNASVSLVRDQVYRVAEWEPDRDGAGFVRLVGCDMYWFDASRFEFRQRAFQPGDRVVCVDDGRSNIIHNGKHYTIADHDNGWVKLVGEEQYTYAVDRFRLVTEATALRTSVFKILVRLLAAFVRVLTLRSRRTAIS